MSKNFKITNLQLVRSADESFHEVVCHYTINDVQGHRFIFIANKENANDKYYIEEARKRVIELYESGELKATNKMTKKVRRPWVIGASIGGACAIAFACLFGWAVSNNLIVIAGGGTGGGGGGSSTTWYLDDNYLKSLNESDVGTIQKVTVNGLEHRVRLIGIDHDLLADGPGYAHTTWEFADVLCDRNGYSLATFWNDDTTNPLVPCYSYTNSTLRKNLVGEGNASISWYEKVDSGYAYKSTNYTKPVIDMLPANLVNKIKPVVKNTIVCVTGTTTSWEQWEQWNFSTITCTDKLFLLSSTELKKVPRRHSTSDYVYDYYDSGCAWDAKDSRYVKRQIKYEQSDGALTHEITVGDAKYGGLAVSIAGYNSTDRFSDSGTKCGTGYYLRDIIDRPLMCGDGCGFPMAASSGGVCCEGNHSKGNDLAAPIAPAFCL